MCEKQYCENRGLVITVSNPRTLQRVTAKHFVFIYCLSVDKALSVWENNLLKTRADCSGTPILSVVGLGGCVFVVCLLICLFYFILFFYLFFGVGSII